MQGRQSSREEATVVLVGVVVPAAPWLRVLAADPPGQMHLQQRLDKVLLSQSELPLLQWLHSEGS